MSVTTKAEIMWETWNNESPAKSGKIALPQAYLDIPQEPSPCCFL